jgi:hypothetical protein
MDELDAILRLERERCGESGLDHRGGGSGIENEVKGPFAVHLHRHHHRLSPEQPESHRLAR